MKQFLYEVKKTVLARNPIVRTIQTKNYSVKKVAIGESNDDKFPKDWIKINQSNADYNIDLNSDYTLPFEDNSIDLVFSAHCLEHLTEKKSQAILNECFRIMAKGATIRIEVPDASKIIQCYKESTPAYVEHFKVRYTQLVKEFGYPNNFLQPHVGMMGTISNYFDDSLNYQIPVYATQEECDKHLEKMNLDEFCKWCVSLQTPTQYATPGHKSFFYFKKMQKMLAHAGFEQVANMDFNQTNCKAFKLNEPGGKGIQEKLHRKFYSLYVEAQKI